MNKLVLGHEFLPVTFGVDECAYRDAHGVICGKPAIEHRTLTIVERFLAWLDRNQPEVSRR